MEDARSAWLRRAARDDPGIKRWQAGTHRTRPPAETIEALRRLMPRLGITRVGNLTGLDRIGIPVVMACRPASRSVAVSLGKGLDLDAAFASAVMESAETWHAERIVLPTYLGSRRELEGRHRFLDVEGLAHQPGRPWHADRRLLWTPTVELFGDRPVLVPYELVHTDYTVPAPVGSGLFWGSTNGLASGNHRLEALAYALCELIERDATARWQHLPTHDKAARRLDLTSVDDPACRSVLERFAAAGIEVAVWDTTTEVGVAAFFCLIRDARDPSGHPASGAGCHGAAAVALLRALTEAAQVRATYIAGARDDLPPEEFGRAALARKLARIAPAMAGAGLRRFADVPSVAFPTFAADVDHVLGRLQAAGYPEAAMIDLTREEIGVAVVRAVVPGLRLEDAADLPGSRRRIAPESAPEPETAP